MDAVFEIVVFAILLWLTIDLCRSIALIHQGLFIVPLLKLYRLVTSLIALLTAIQLWNVLQIIGVLQ